MNALIYGAGYLGRQFYNFINAQRPGDYTVMGFIDDTKSVNADVVGGLTVMGGLKYLQDGSVFDPKTTALFIAIGYKDLPRRYELYLTCKEIGYVFPNLIHQGSHVENDLIIGEGNVILPGAVIDHNVSIGNINFIDINVSVSHDNTIGDNNFLTVATATAGFVTIGNSNFVGMQSTLTDRVTVGNNNFLSARCILTRNIKNNKRIVTVTEQKIFEDN